MLNNNSFNYIEETINYLVNNKCDTTNKQSIDLNLSFNNPDRCKIYQILDYIYYHTCYDCDEIINDMIMFGYDINNLSHWEHYRDEIMYRKEIYEIEHCCT